MATSQYSTAEPFFGTKEPWILNVQDQNRLAAYAFYGDVYDNVTKTFKLVEESGRSLYIPSGRVIVETMNRYMAPGMSVVVDPAFGDDRQKLLAQQVLTDFMRRERFVSKFNTNKRWGLIRGDWAFYLYADPAKEAGSRISVFGVDPASLFPIYNPTNIDEIIGWHMVDYYLNDDGDPVLKRQTWRKVTEQGGPSPITVEIGLYDPEEWGGPGMLEDDAVLLEQVMPPTLLPSPIDSLPIYHIPNRDRPGDIWGVSEMQGLEILIRALSQGASDEDLSLALDGLGVWVTDSGAPVNDEDEEVPWNLGPGRVVEIAEGKSFKRANSTSTVAPYQEHLKFIQQWMDDASAQSPAARGKVDQGVAESGVALALNLAPILASAEEKDQVITDVLTNLFFNLPKWYVAYEGGAFNSLVDATRWVPQFGQKLPTNVTEERKTLTELVTAKILPASYARDRLRRLGYEDMPEESVIAEALAAETAMAQDAFGSRVDAEVNGALGTSDVESI